MKISNYRGNQIELTNKRWQHIITEQARSNSINRITFRRYAEKGKNTKYDVLKVHD